VMNERRVLRSVRGAGNGRFVGGRRRAIVPPLVLGATMLGL